VVKFFHLVDINFEHGVSLSKKVQSFFSMLVSLETDVATAGFADFCRTEEFADHTLQSMNSDRAIAQLLFLFHGYYYIPTRLVTNLNAKLIYTRYKFYAHQPIL